MPRTDRQSWVRLVAAGAAIGALAWSLFGAHRVGLDPFSRDGRPSPRSTAQNAADLGVLSARPLFGVSPNATADRAQVGNLRAYGIVLTPGRQAALIGAQGEAPSWLGLGQMAHGFSVERIGPNEVILLSEDGVEHALRVFADPAGPNPTAP